PKVGKICSRRRPFPDILGPCSKRWSHLRINAMAATPPHPDPSPPSGESLRPLSGNSHETPAPGNAMSSPAGSPPRAVYLKPAERPIRDYELKRKLDKGGFGEVWQTTGPMPGITAGHFMWGRQGIVLLWNYWVTEIKKYGRRPNRLVERNSDGHRDRQRL